MPRTTCSPVESLSVWTERVALSHWVGLPLCRRTVRRNGDRGTLHAVAWPSETFDRAAIRAEADRRLDTGDHS
ncbi:hypothetical protein [Amycolatopsis sp. NPDC051903]|uniref:hypothetical protein n=1 Tax=Amycolatopsis sp. NPDC051903 TaxID=3363936 RepID=UPI00379F20BA